MSSYEEERAIGVFRIKKKNLFKENRYIQRNDTSAVLDLKLKVIMTENFLINNFLCLSMWCIQSLFGDSTHESLA